MSFHFFRGVSWICVECRGIVVAWLCVGMKVYLGNLLLWRKLAWLSVAGHCVAWF